MMVTVKVTATRLELQAPYHPALPGRAKPAGGRWMGSEIGWTFPLNAEHALRALCDEIWAVDGSPEAAAATVDVQIAVDERAPVRTVFLAHERPIYLVGREIAASLANRRAAGARGDVSGGQAVLRRNAEQVEHGYSERICLPYAESAEGRRGAVPVGPLRRRSP